MRNKMIRMIRMILTLVSLSFGPHLTAEVLETLKNAANRPYSGVFVEFIQRKSPAQGGAILVVREGNFCKSAIHEPKVCRAKTYKKGVLRAACTTDANKYIEFLPDAKGYFRLKYQFADAGFYQCATVNNVLKFHLTYSQTQFGTPVRVYLLNRDALLRALSKKPLNYISVLRPSSAETAGYLSYYNKQFAREIREAQIQASVRSKKAAQQAAKKKGATPKKKK